MTGTPPDFLDAVERGRWDVEFFALYFLGVRLHPGQKRLLDAYIKRDQTLWRAAYLTLALSAGNRAGKTLALAILILHSCFYKMGVRPPDPTSDQSIHAWLVREYEWYHFGIQQEVGDLVFMEIDRLYRGEHEAQEGRGCPLSAHIGDQWLTTDKKWRGEYRWVSFAKELGGAQVHFRTTSERALGSLGKDMSGVSFDECGFEMNLTFIVNEVLHLRRLSTGGQLILISTPSEGFTQFADEWRKGDPDDPERLPGHMSLRMSTRDNIGFGIDAIIFERLIAAMPESLVPQNIDGYFIEGRKAFFNGEAVDRAFVDSLPYKARARRGHRYVQGVDPAITYDATWGFVLDTTDPDAIYGVDVRRKTGKQTVLSVVALITEQHEAYDTQTSQCVTGCDVTGFGGKVFRDLLRNVSPFRGVEFGGTKSRKVKLLTDLKGLLEQGRLRFPREKEWLGLRRQLLGYRLDDRKIEQDAVMALAVAVKMALTSGGTETDAEFEFFRTTDDGTLVKQEARPLSAQDLNWKRLQAHGARAKLFAE